MLAYWYYPEVSVGACFYGSFSCMYAITMQHLVIDILADELKKRTCQHLGCQLPQDATFHFVRKVSPNKLMFCVSFVLPKAVLFEKTSREVDSTFADEPPKKRLKP